MQTISSEKEKWVSLLSADTPEKVQEVAAYSEEMFEIISEVAAYTSDIKEVMNMFSEALYILDRNTEKYMIDEAMKWTSRRKNVVPIHGRTSNCELENVYGKDEALF